MALPQDLLVNTFQYLDIFSLLTQQAVSLDFCIASRNKHSYTPNKNFIPTLVHYNQMNDNTYLHEFLTKSNLYPLSLATSVQVHVNEKISMNSNNNLQLLNNTHSKSITNIFPKMKNLKLTTWFPFRIF